MILVSTVRCQPLNCPLLSQDDDQADALTTAAGRWPALREAAPPRVRSVTPGGGTQWSPARLEGSLARMTPRFDVRSVELVGNRYRPSQANRLGYVDAQGNLYKLATHLDVLSTGDRVFLGALANDHHSLPVRWSLTPWVVRKTKYGTAETWLRDNRRLFLLVKRAKA